MSDKKNTNLKTYDAQAQDLARSYNAVTTPDIIPAFTQRIALMEACENLRALDVGCGSGRDASWLARQGFQVVACDGAAEMVKAAQQENSHPNIRYMSDAAPALSKVSALQERYDVILLNAFIFHLDYQPPHDELSVLFDVVARLCAPDAFVYTNLRHGPVPEGRQMYDIPLAQLERIAQDHGFAFEHLGRSADGLGRVDVSWDNVALRAPS